VEHRAVTARASPDRQAIAPLRAALAGDAASFVNGHDLVVDGGVVAGQRWSTMVAQRQELARLVQPGR
jgi:hypothetical protein